MAFLAAAGAAGGAGEAAGASTALDVGAGASLTSGVEAYGAGSTATEASTAAGVGAGGASAAGLGTQGSKLLDSMIAQVKKYFSNPENIKDLSKLLQQYGNMQSTVHKLGPDTRSIYDGITKSAMAANANVEGTGQHGPLAPSGPYLGDISNYQIDPQMAQRALSMLRGQ